jgi:hypothetical protein
VDVDWAELALAMVAPADPAARLRANLGACAHMLRNAKAYEPGVFSCPDDWSKANEDFIARLRLTSKQQGFDIRAAATAEPHAFGRWRAAVTDFEALEAGKLQALLWSVRTARAVAEDAASDESDSALAGKLGHDLWQKVTLVWKCQTVPLDGDARAWATKQTRRFDLLPKFWRYV